MPPTQKHETWHDSLTKVLHQLIDAAILPDADMNTAAQLQAIITDAIQKATPDASALAGMGAAGPGHGMPPGMASGGMGGPPGGGMQIGPGGMAPPGGGAPPPGGMPPPGPGMGPSLTGGGGPGPEELSRLLGQGAGG